MTCPWDQLSLENKDLPYILAAGITTHRPALPPGPTGLTGGNSQVAHHENDTVMPTW